MEATEIDGGRGEALHEVTVLGREFRIRSSAGRDHLEEVAGFVDRRVGALTQGRPQNASQTVILMAAMSMADELLTIRREHEALRERIRAGSKALLDRLQPAP
jgi:cell division protein ZapA (FtsZ GTPase activity inhibitor)